ncbi:MAG: hypothetical protein HYT36_03175 [Candidatus Staskawiczbacteria bacterium]|nr:hypothetical protein [Candidatus Staskawiczbacteria bacterium]
MLPGLENLHSVISTIIGKMMLNWDNRDIPVELWEKIELELCDSRNWYVAGAGHITPQPAEVEEWAKSLIENYRKKSS